VSESTPPTDVRVEITRPKVYGTPAVLAVHTYGFLLVIPVLASIAGLSLLPAGFGPLLLPLAAVIVTACFLPLGLGNPHISRLVRSFCAEAQRGDRGYIVQATFTPRIRSGLRAVLEDADDIGFLCFTDSALVFHGDSVRLSIPFQQLGEVRPQNVGLRGLFVYGLRIEVPVKGIPQLAAIQFAERSSLLLTGSRRTTRRLRDQFIALGAAERQPAGR